MLFRKFQEFYTFYRMTELKLCHSESRKRLKWNMLPLLGLSEWYQHVFYQTERAPYTRWASSMVTTSLCTNFQACTVPDESAGPNCTHSRGHVHIRSKHRLNTPIILYCTTRIGFGELFEKAARDGQRKMSRVSSSTQRAMLVPPLHQTSSSSSFIVVLFIFRIVS